MKRAECNDGIEQSETFRAFADVVRYCAANRELVSEFNRLTGHKLFQARTPIEIAIDNACQHDPDAEGMPDFLQFVWSCIFVPMCNGWKNEYEAPKMERFETHIGFNRDPLETASMSTDELAKEIRDSDEWDIDLLRDLCYRAGILDEWEASDCLTFESVALKAAEMLGVEIL